MFNRNDTRFGLAMMIGMGSVILALLIAGFGFLMLIATGGGLLLFAVLAPIMLAFGVFLMAGVLLRGLWLERQGNAMGGLRVENGAWVQARFAIAPGSSDMMFSEDFFDPELPGLKLFVRLKYPDGRVDEPKTSLPVWRMCGEGMVGIAEIQGDWLTRYTPQPRPTAPPTV